MTAFIAAIFLISSCGQAWNGKQDDTKAKYIFLFIGDGMGANHVAAAESYLSYKAGKIGGEQLVFTTFPYHGTATNFSANRHVTCSAASGTAIACGSKTDNSKLGMDKDGNALKSVAKELKEDGYKIGIITTPFSLEKGAAPGRPLFYKNCDGYKRYFYTLRCPLSDAL